MIIIFTEVETEQYVLASEVTLEVHTPGETHHKHCFVYETTHGILGLDVAPTLVSKVFVVVVLSVRMLVADLSASACLDTM